MSRGWLIQHKKADAERFARTCTRSLSSAEVQCSGGRLEAAQSQRHASVNTTISSLPEEGGK